MSHLIVPINEKDHLLGQINAPVTFVEYGDYECPLCRLSHPIIKQLRKELGEKLCFVFRHFPLKQSHPDAFPLAQASEAASQQNKFWEMNEALFEKQRQADEASLLELAGKLHLNSEKFINDLNSPSTIQKIEDDFKMGVRSGVNGTPCYYINNERYDGDRSYSSLLQALQNKL